VRSGALIAPFCLALAGAGLLPGPAPALRAAAGQEPGRLQEATVSVERAADSARVRASYRFGPGNGAIELTAIRLRGQGIHLDSLGTAGGEARVHGEVERRAGTWRIRIERSALQDGALTLTYRTYGRPARIPVFVPSWPTDPLTSRVEIRARGYPTDVGAGATFPHLEAGGRDVLEGRLAELPGFIHVAVATGGPGPDAIASFVVVALVLGGVGAWLMLRSRVRRRDARRSGGARESGGAPGPGDRSASDSPRG